MMAVVKVQWDLEFARNEIFSFSFSSFSLKSSASEAGGVNF